MLFLQPVMTAAQSNTGQQSVTNETVTANYGKYVELDGYDIDTNSETVWGYNDTSGNYEQAVKGTDYEINYDGGELKVLNGSTLIEDGEDVKVSYDYQASGQTTALVAGFVPIMLVLLLFVAVAMRVTVFL
ncbi:MAG: hypothetical protein ABEI98_00070 [Halorhabdus sp.]